MSPDPGRLSSMIHSPASLPLGHIGPERTFDR